MARLSSTSTASRPAAQPVIADGLGERRDEVVVTEIERDVRQAYRSVVEENLKDDPHGHESLKKSWFEL